MGGASAAAEEDGAAIAAAEGGASAAAEAGGASAAAEEGGAFVAAEEGGASAVAEEDGASAAEEEAGAATAGEGGAHSPPFDITAADIAASESTADAAGDDNGVVASAEDHSSSGLSIGLPPQEPAAGPAPGAGGLTLDTSLLSPDTFPALLVSPSSLSFSPSFPVNGENLFVPPLGNTGAELAEVLPAESAVTEVSESAGAEHTAEVPLADFAASSVEFSRGATEAGSSMESALSEPSLAASTP